MSVLECSVAVEYFIAPPCIAIPCGCQNPTVSFAASRLKWLPLALWEWNQGTEKPQTLSPVPRAPAQPVALAG